MADRFLERHDKGGDVLDELPLITYVYPTPVFMETQLQFSRKPGGVVVRRRVQQYNTYIKGHESKKKQKYALKIREIEAFAFGIALKQKGKRATQFHKRDF